MSENHLMTELNSLTPSSTQVVSHPDTPLEAPQNQGEPTPASKNPQEKKGHIPGLLGLLPFIKPYRMQVLWAGIFLVLAAASTLTFPYALKLLIDQGLSAESSRSTLSWHFFLLFWVSVALAFFSSARFYMVSWLGERITNDVRQTVYAHVLKQSPAFFEVTQTGEVLSRLSSDTTLVQTVVGSSLSMGLRNLVMGIGALLMLIWTNPLLMLQVIVLLLVVVAPSVALGRRVRKLSRASQDRVADTSAIAQEVLNAIPVVQSYTAEQRESLRYVNASTQAFGTAIKRVRARSLLVAFILTTTSAALLWGLYQGALAVMQGTLSAGELGQTLVYVLLLASAFAVLGEVYGDLLRAAGATERLIELLNTRSPVKEPESPMVIVRPSGGAHLEVSNVSFAYPSRTDKNALSELNFSIKAGENAALLGPSGAGKTSVFSLLLRFYDPQMGEIRLNGIPIQNMALRDLRQGIGLVPQEPVIFSTSAFENILYGNPNASKEEVYKAAKAAFADEFIEQLSEGYDTYLGERGVRLSGGQKQRIAIARAILKNPPLLLLDEATSALDANSERMVQLALDKAMEDRTTLVIAHRFSTVKKCNPLLVLEKGHLVESGTHEDLLSHGGLYAKLSKLQFQANESA